MIECKYLNDGRKVVVVGQLNNVESIVQEIFVTEAGDEIPSKTPEEDMILVPVELIKAIAHIGVDFGYGSYILEDKFINQAKDLLDE